MPAVTAYLPAFHPPPQIDQIEKEIATAKEISPINATKFFKKLLI